MTTSLRDILFPKAMHSFTCQTPNSFLVFKCCAQHIPDTYMCTHKNTLAHVSLPSEAHLYNSNFVQQRGILAPCSMRPMYHVQHLVFVRRLIRICRLLLRLASRSRRLSIATATFLRPGTSRQPFIHRHDFYLFRVGFPP